jgi:hypothetical protein
VVGDFLVVQVPDPSNERTVSLCLGPIDGFLLGAKYAKYMVGVVLDHIVIDT